MKYLESEFSRWKQERTAPQHIQKAMNLLQELPEDYKAAVDALEFAAFRAGVCEGFREGRDFRTCSSESKLKGGFEK